MTPSSLAPAVAESGRTTMSAETLKHKEVDFAEPIVKLHKTDATIPTHSREL